MKSDIKVVIFDLGQTLIAYNLEEFFFYLEENFQYKKKTVQEVVGIVFEGENYRLYERGVYSTDEYYKRIVKVLEIDNLSLEDFKKAFCCIFSANKGIENLLRELSRNYKLLFISNLSKIHWELALSKQDIIREFFPANWQQVLSYKEGSQKPEAEIYLKALSNAEVSSSEAIFFDDKEENVTGFRKIGGFAERYNCKEQTVEKLRFMLEKYQLI